MGKKIYIRGSNYGGEMTIGEVTKEFVEYWQPICKEEGDSRLVEHLMALDTWDNDPEDEEGFDKDSPKVYEDMETWNNWYECDDIHHHNSSSGTELWAFPITSESDGYPEYDWDDRIEFEPHQLYSRECYTQAEPSTKDKEDNSVPVLVFYSSEKGEFGSWTIELADNETFDPKKIAVSVVETDQGEMVERLFYDKKEYECEYDWCDSRGKGYYADVGWFNKRWEDPHLDEETDKEMWDDAWDYYDAEMEELREQERKEYEQARAQKIADNPGWEPGQ